MGAIDMVLIEQRAPARAGRTFVLDAGVRGRHQLATFRAQSRREFDVLAIEEESRVEETWSDGRWRQQ
ncbi:hypothetical protein D3C72_2115460 [compost metagenome]